MSKKILSLTVIVSFIFTSLGPYPQAHASTFGLPTPGSMVNLSPAYTPALIKGLTVHKDNPFLFDFILDTGNSRIAGDELKAQGDRLVKYFFACLTIPEKDLWVNLSPYEKDRMVPQALGQTALGRDLLAQDYILKQLTASLIYPEKNLGREFWDKVYAKAQEMYGTTQIPVNTFNKVWIVADKASVYEHNQTAFVVSGHMKVMLEEDYLALEKNQRGKGYGIRDKQNKLIPYPLSLIPNSTLTSKIIRQIILPEIEREVNQGQNFSTLRQIFNSLILASWYKKNLKKALLNQVYADKSTVKGVNLADPSIKERIYQQYIKAYKKGVFNYIKEDAQPNGQTIPRKYFSGGFVVGLDITNAAPAMAAASLDPVGSDFAMDVKLNLNNISLDSAMSHALSVLNPIFGDNPEAQAKLTSSKELTDAFYHLLNALKKLNFHEEINIFMKKILGQEDNLALAKGLTTAIWLIRGDLKSVLREEVMRRIVRLSLESENPLMQIQQFEDPEVMNLFVLLDYRFRNKDRMPKSGNGYAAWLDAINSTFSNIEKSENVFIQLRRASYVLEQWPNLHNVIGQDEEELWRVIGVLCVSGKNVTWEEVHNSIMRVLRRDLENGQLAAVKKIFDHLPGNTAMLTEPYDNVETMYKRLPDDIMDSITSLAANISGGEDLLANKGAFKDIMDQMRGIYEQEMEGLTTKNYHNDMHNLIVTMGGLLIAGNTGLIKTKRDLVVTSLAEMFHDFHIRAVWPKRDRGPASPALVDETLGRLEADGSVSGGQLRDLLGIEGFVYQKPVETNNARYLEKVDNKFKKDIREDFQGLVGTDDPVEIYNEIAAIIRRSDFPSDVQLGASGRYKSRTSTVREFIDMTINDWSNVNPEFSNGDLKDLMEQVEIKYKDILADLARDTDVEFVNQANKKDITEKFLLRQWYIERHFLETLYKVTASRRFNIFQIANRVELADQTFSAWIGTPKVAEEITLGLNKELPYVSVEANFPLFYTMQVLLARTLSGLKEGLPLNFRINLFNNMQYFANHSTTFAKGLTEDERAAKYPDFLYYPMLHSLGEWEKMKDNVLMNLGLYMEEDGQIKEQTGDPDLVQGLRKSLIGNYFNLRQIHSMVANGAVVKLPPKSEHDSIMQEDEPLGPQDSDGVFVVVHGKVDVSKGGDTKATLGPGRNFGELAVISRLPRNATIVAAATPTVLLLMPSQYLHGLILVNDDFSTALYRDARSKVTTGESLPDWLKSKIVMKMWRTEQKSKRKFKVTPWADPIIVKGAEKRDELLTMDLVKELLPQALDEFQIEYPQAKMDQVKMVAIAENGSSGPFASIYIDPIDGKKVIELSSDFFKGNLNTFNDRIKAVLLHKMTVNKAMLFAQEIQEYTEALQANGLLPEFSKYLKADFISMVLQWIYGQYDKEAFEKDSHQIATSVFKAVVEILNKNKQDGKDIDPMDVFIYSGPDFSPENIGRAYDVTKLVQPIIESKKASKNFLITLEKIIQLKFEDLYKVNVAFVNLITAVFEAKINGFIDEKVYTTLVNRAKDKEVSLEEVFNTLASRIKMGTVHNVNDFNKECDLILAKDIADLQQQHSAGSMEGVSIWDIPSSVIYRYGKQKLVKAGITTFSDIEKYDLESLIRISGIKREEAFKLKRFVAFFKGNLSEKSIDELPLDEEQIKSIKEAGIKTVGELQNIDIKKLLSQLDYTDHHFKIERVGFGLTIVRNLEAWVHGRISPTYEPVTNRAMMIKDGENPPVIDTILDKIESIAKDEAGDDQDTFETAEFIIMALRDNYLIYSSEQLKSCVDSLKAEIDKIIGKSLENAPSKGKHVLLAYLFYALYSIVKVSGFLKHHLEPSVDVPFVADDTSKEYLIFRQKEPKWEIKGFRVPLLTTAKFLEAAGLENSQDDPMEFEDDLKLANNYKVIAGIANRIFEICNELAKPKSIADGLKDTMEFGFTWRIAAYNGLVSVPIEGGDKDANYLTARIKSGTLNPNTVNKVQIETLKNFNKENSVTPIVVAFFIYIHSKDSIDAVVEIYENLDITERLKMLAYLRALDDKTIDSSAFLKTPSLWFELLRQSHGSTDVADILEENYKDFPGGSNTFNMDGAMINTKWDETPVEITGNSLSMAAGRHVSTMKAQVDAAMTRDDWEVRTADLGNIRNLLSSNRFYDSDDFKAKANELGLIYEYDKPNGWLSGGSLQDVAYTSGYTDKNFEHEQVVFMNSQLEPLHFMTLASLPKQPGILMFVSKKNHVTYYIVESTDVRPMTRDDWIGRFKNLRLIKVLLQSANYYNTQSIEDGARVYGFVYEYLKPDNWGPGKSLQKLALSLGYTEKNFDHEKVLFLDLNMEPVHSIKIGSLPEQPGVFKFVDQKNQMTYYVLDLVDVHGMTSEGWDSRISDLENIYTIIQNFSGTSRYVVNEADSKGLDIKYSEPDNWDSGETLQEIAHSSGYTQKNLDHTRVLFFDTKMNPLHSTKLATLPAQPGLWKFTNQETHEIYYIVELDEDEAMIAKNRGENDPIPSREDLVGSLTQEMNSKRNLLTIDVYKDQILVHYGPTIDSLVHWYAGVSISGDFTEDGLKIAEKIRQGLLALGLPTEINQGGFLSIVQEVLKHGMSSEPWSDFQETHYDHELLKDKHRRGLEDNKAQLTVKALAFKDKLGDSERISTGIVETWRNTKLTWEDLKSILGPAGKGVENRNLRLGAVMALRRPLSTSIKSYLQFVEDAKKDPDAWKMLLDIALDKNEDPSIRLNSYLSLANLDFQKALPLIEEQLTISAGSVTYFQKKLITNISYDIKEFQGIKDIRKILHYYLGYFLTLPNLTYLDRTAKKAVVHAIDNIDRASLSVMTNPTNGGIDLNTSKGMQWQDTKEGQGVEMDFDRAMFARISQDGVKSLTPFIYRITPLKSIWPLAGLKEPPASAERLAQV